MLGLQLQQVNISINARYHGLAKRTHLTRVCGTENSSLSVLASVIGIAYRRCVHPIDCQVPKFDFTQSL
jgi:hypothetical protein